MTSHARRRVESVFGQFLCYQPGVGAGCFGGPLLFAGKAGMNLDDVNRDPVLHRTPIGRLSVVRIDGLVNVVVDDGRSKPRIIHVVQPGGSVFDALYGKNALVQRETRARYEQRDHERKQAYELQKLSENRDFERRLHRLFARKGDEARDVARRMLGVRA